MRQGMSRFVFLLFSAVLLVFALEVIYYHGREVWYKQAEYGWWEAVTMELGIGGFPLVGSIILVIIVLGLFVWIERTDRKRHEEQMQRRDKLDQALLKSLNSIAKKLGMDVDNDDKPK